VAKSLIPGKILIKSRDEEKESPSHRLAFITPKQFHYEDKGFSLDP